MQPKLAQRRATVLTVAKKPKRWSHQNDLDALIGKKIYIKLPNDPVFEAKLVAADQFTIKVKRFSENTKLTHTFFKHHITYIASETPQE